MAVDGATRNQAAAPWSLIPSSIAAILETLCTQDAPANDHPTIWNMQDYVSGQDIQKSHRKQWQTRHFYAKP
jgi:hypothetical protein